MCHCSQEPVRLSKPFHQPAQRSWELSLFGLVSSAGRLDLDFGGYCLGRLCLLLCKGWAQSRYCENRNSIQDQQANNIFDKLADAGIKNSSFLDGPLASLA